MKPHRAFISSYQTSLCTLFVWWECVYCCLSFCTPALMIDLCVILEICLAAGGSNQAPYYYAVRRSNKTTPDASIRLFIVSIILVSSKATQVNFLFVAPCCWKQNGATGSGRFGCLKPLLYGTIPFYLICLSLSVILHLCLYTSILTKSDSRFWQDSRCSVIQLFPRICWRKWGRPMHWAFQKGRGFASSTSAL